MKPFSLQTFLEERIMELNQKLENPYQKHKSEIEEKLDRLRQLLHDLFDAV